MAEIVILCVLAIAMGEIYSRTKRPKLYALLNTAAGAGSLILSQLIINGGICLNSYNCAFSGILGIPGTVLISLLQTGG